MDYSKIEEIRRRDSKLSQSQLAEKAGIHPKTYQRILKEGNTTIETLEKISNALGVPVTYWFTDEITNPTDMTDQTNELIRLYKKVESLMDENSKLKEIIKDLELRNFRIGDRSATA